MSKRWPDKIVVGLTGNIATGKSAVMEMAAECGALAIDADRLVHEILDNDLDTQAAVGRVFGQELLYEDGRVDRKALGAIVFEDSAALRRLESLVHPPVRRLLSEQIAASEETVVFVEAIKLLEGGLAEECDQIWVTRCPYETQLQRLIVCRGLRQQEAEGRILAQSDQAIKVARADVVIDTDGTMADTQAYFDLAWQRVAKMVPEPEPEIELEVSEETPAAPAEVTQTYPGDVRVRRARPADVPAISLLIRKATDGAVRLKKSELLMALGDRGYLIGQRGVEISTVAGWNAENLVAIVEHFYVEPLETVTTTGAAVLAEIEKTAISLICEVIFAVLPEEGPAEVAELFTGRGFVPAEAAVLPKAWRKAVGEVLGEDNRLLMKILRATRAL